MAALLKKGVIYFRNLKLRKKMAFSMTLIILFSTILMLLLIYVQSKAIVQEKSIKETHETVVQLANYYNEKLLKLMDLAHGIFENDDFKKSLGNILWNDQYNYAVESTTMQRLFQLTRLKESFLDSFFLYTDREYFYENQFIIRPDLNFTKTDMYKNFEKNHTICWQISGNDEIFSNTDKVIPVVMNTAVEGVYDRAIFVMNLKTSQFTDSLKGISNANNSSIYIVNSSGAVVTSYEYNDYKSAVTEPDFENKLAADQSGSFSFSYGGRKLIVNYANINVNGWKVVIVLSEATLLKDVTKLQFYVLLIGLISITVAVMLSFIVASTITKPISSLEKTMQKVQSGDLQSRFKSKFSDEIGQLGSSFNSMLDEIQSLIREIEIEREKTKEEQKQKVKAEIKALQSQINPHFLYNTLDSIYWKSKLGENDLASDMIVSLSKLLRIGLSKGRDKIPVEDEIEHARNYLYLQSSMYSNKFEYSIEVSGDIRKYGTVKLLIQPIVENSLLHGFENIMYMGKIDISVEVRDSKIYYIITDNGMGFDVAAAEDSLKSGNAEPTGYALKNVYQRLKLNYGDEAGMGFESTPNKETRVIIFLPAEEI